MTNKERTLCFLNRQKADRIGVYEHFWGDTISAWTKQGFIKPGENTADHFNYDLVQFKPFELTADYRMTPVTLEETEETILQKNGNGAVLRTHKLHASTPEHVDFLVKDKKTWEKYAKPLLTPDPGRIDFDKYSEIKTRSDNSGRFFCWTGLQVF